MLYDYYYSEKFEIHITEIKYQKREKHIAPLINGTKYSEMIETGKTPILKENYPDLKRILHAYL